MRTLITIVATVIMGMAVGTALARDTRHMYPIEAALNTPAAKERLGSTMRFYFGQQEHPPVARELGEYTANRKTNAANKSDQKACEWVFLSALLALRDRAVQEGGDAVIDIKSFYKNNEVVSEGEYECHAGSFVAGVALRGMVVKLAQ